MILINSLIKLSNSNLSHKYYVKYVNKISIVLKNSKIIL